MLLATHLLVAHLRAHAVEARLLSVLGALGELAVGQHGHRDAVLVGQQELPGGSN